MTTTYSATADLLASARAPYVNFTGDGGEEGFWKCPFFACAVEPEELTHGHPSDAIRNHRDRRTAIACDHVPRPSGDQVTPAIAAARAGVDFDAERAGRIMKMVRMGRVEDAPRLDEQREPTTAFAREVPR